MTDRDDTKVSVNTEPFTYAAFKCGVCQQACAVDLKVVKALVEGAAVSCSSCKVDVHASHYDRDVLAFIVERIDLRKNDAPLLRVVFWVATAVVFLGASILLGLLLMLLGGAHAVMNNRTIPNAQNTVVLKSASL